MKKGIFLSIAVSVLFISCGGGNSSENKKVKSQLENQPNSSITDSTSTLKQAKNTIRGINMLQTSNTNMQMPGNIFADENRINRSIGNLNIQNEYNQYCSNGGIINVDDLFSQSREISFNNCNEENYLLNGIVKISSSNDNLYKMSYNNFSLNYIDFKLYTKSLLAKIDHSSNGQTHINYSGDISIAKDNLKYDIYYKNYDIKISKDLTFQQNGTVNITSSPKNCNANGNYKLETLENLKLSNNLSKIVEGKLKINNTIYEYKNDGSVDVRINGEIKNIKLENEYCL